jgi:hypothetical protein
MRTKAAIPRTATTTTTRMIGRGAPPDDPDECLAVAADARVLWDFDDAVDEEVAVDGLLVVVASAPDALGVVLEPDVAWTVVVVWSAVVAVCVLPDAVVGVPGVEARVVGVDALVVVVTPVVGVVVATVVGGTTEMPEQMEA